MVKSLVAAFLAVLSLVSVPRLPHHFLIVGDSEACAIGSVANESLSSFKHGDIADTVCKSGSRVEFWETNIKKALDLHETADTVVVFLGTNHYLDTRAPSIDKITDEILKRNKQCVWVGNFAVKGRKWPINEQLKQAVSKTACLYYDAEEVPIKLHDTIHPDRYNSLLFSYGLWSWMGL